LKLNDYEAMHTEIPDPSGRQLFWFIVANESIHAKAIAAERAACHLAGAVCPAKAFERKGTVRLSRLNF